MQPGWSWQRLLDDATIEPARFMHSWWQDRPVSWHYARPVAMALMKIVYELSGGDPLPQHAVSIALHLASAWMVYALCFMLTGRRGWSAVGGMIFAAYSHATIAVAWLAAQNAILQTNLTLAAMLAYVKASGLRLRREYGPILASATECAAPSEVHARSAESTGAASPVRDAMTAPSPEQPAPLRDDVPKIRWGWLCTCLTLWATAVLSRENALILPIMLAGLDLSFGGWRWVRARLAVYAPFVACGAAFAIWRLTALYFPMPDVYFRRYDGPEYVGWYLVKLLHYICSSVWLSPMTIGPSGRYNPIAEVPGDCLLMLAIVGFMGAGYWLACRRIRGWWLWPLWILLSVLPVVPLMASPHSGYMPGVGFAVAMVIGPALRSRARPTGIGKWSPAVAIYFLVATHVYFPIYRTLQQSLVAAERVTIGSVAVYGAPQTVMGAERSREGSSAASATRAVGWAVPTTRAQSQPTECADTTHPALAHFAELVGTAHPTSFGLGERTEVFFINLPFVNIYAHTCLREVWGDAAESVRCHALTYAPNLLSMDQPFRIRQLDEKRFELSTDGRPYFSGFLGRFLLDGMRSAGPFHAGDTIHAELFDVEIVEGGAAGVSKLLFAFHEPLASPRFRFFVSSSECPAAEMRFATADEIAEPGRSAIRGDIGEVIALVDADGRSHFILGSRDAPAQTIERVARAIGGPALKLVAAERGLSDFPSWFRNHVLSKSFDQIDAAARSFDDVLSARGGLNVIRSNAARFIRTDLYLTGPPYPGPRE